MLQEPLRLRRQPRIGQEGVDWRMAAWLEESVMNVIHVAPYRLQCEVAASGGPPPDAGSAAT